MFALRRILSTLALASSAALAAPVDVTVYADDAYPPYSYAVDGEARGIYPGILREAFAHMPGYRVHLLPVPWKRGLRMLETGEAFALVPPYLRPAERPYMDYSAPIYSESVTLFCNSGKLTPGVARRWPEDFLGLRIGTNAGYLLGGKEFEQVRRAGLVTLEEARGTDENLRKLLLGRLDCYMNDRSAILFALHRIQAEPPYQHANGVSEMAVLSEEYGYLGVTRLEPARYSFKQDFLRQFNAALSEIKRNGRLEQIVSQELQR